MKRMTIIIPALLLGISVTGITVSQAFAQSNSNASTSSFWQSDGYGGMMGGFAGNIQSVKAADAIEVVKTSLRHVSVDKAKNTIIYKGKTVKIVALGGAMDNSKSGPAEKFIIGGLTNPTVQIPKGAKVTLELINEDTDMPHGMEITNAQPPYGYMSMMQGGIFPATFIPPIPAASSSSYPVATTTFTATQSGTFHYICEYPGHAAEGMYGKLIIK